VFFFSRDVKFPTLFSEKGEKQQESEREKLGVGESFFFFPSPKSTKNFSLRLKKNQKYVPIKRALFARYESLARRKNG
jgi:hypothetical protein